MPLIDEVVWQSPRWLWALALLPALAVAYLVWARRAGGAGRTWADPALLPVGVTRRVQVTRALAASLALLALAAGVVAMARPSLPAVEDRRTSVVVLTIDVSTSMNRTDLAPDRMAAAIDAAGRFLEVVPEDTLVGLVTFARGAQVVVAPTRDHARVRSETDRLETIRGRTALGEALVTALGALRAAGAVTEGPPDPVNAPGRILLLTDGLDTAPNAATPEQATERAAADGVPVFAILLGDDPGEEARGAATPAETLAAMSTRTGGVFAQSTTTADLRAVLDDLGSVVAPVERLREITAWWVGAALCLLLGALLVVGLGHPPATARRRAAPESFPASGRRP
jgi:Ca-activated chloride channel homolog